MFSFIINVCCRDNSEDDGTGENGEDIGIGEVDTGYGGTNSERYAFCSVECAPEASPQPTLTEEESRFAKCFVPCSMRGFMSTTMHAISTNCTELCSCTVACEMKNDGESGESGESDTDCDYNCRYAGADDDFPHAGSP